MTTSIDPLEGYVRIESSGYGLSNITEVAPKILDINELANTILERV